MQHTQFLNPIAVSTAEASRLTGLSERTIHRYCTQKKLDKRKIGARAVVTYASLVSLIDDGTAA
mgnify:CR=1 FL=1